MKGVLVVIFSLAFIILISGCVQEFDIRDIARSNDDVRDFLDKYPDARITMVPFTNETIAMDADFISNCPGVAAGNYYKINVLDPSTGSQIILWMDLTDRSIVCMKTEESLQSSATGGNNQSKTTGNGQSGAANQSGTTLTNQSNQSAEGICADTVCNNICMSNVRYYNGTCNATTGNCDYISYEICNNGCENGVCNPAPEPTCTPGLKCYSSEIAGYQSSNCLWSNLSACSNGCSDGVCLEPDFCANVTCNNYCVGNVNYHTGVCNANTGQCQYSSEVCNYGCQGTSVCNKLCLTQTSSFLTVDPLEMADDDTSLLYVLNNGQGVDTINVYDTSGTQVRSFNTPNIYTRGIAFLNDKVYITYDYPNEKVGILNKMTGALESSFTPVIAGLTTLDNIERYGTSDLIFGWNNRTYWYNIATSSVIRTLEISYGLKSPIIWALGFDDNNTLYMAGGYNSTMWKTNRTGSVEGRFDTGLNDIRGISWMNGKLYVADRSTKRIYEYNTTC